MRKKRKLQDRDWRYDILHRLVNLTTKASFRKIKYAGMERIPKDAAIIFAPNHTGALMDAMVILAMDYSPKVFIARADIFRNPKLAAMFKFFKMMPIMRMRDGIEEVKKNNKAIGIAADVLKDKVPLCIFPEGTHQTKYSMLPLSKGIFRIALQAKELLGDTPLYIVPVGIRYGNFYRFRSSVHVQVGNPINVGEFIESHKEKTPQEQMVMMRECLAARIKENIHYIANDEEYDAKNEICAAVSRMQLKNKNSKSRVPLVAVNQEAVRQIETLKRENPEQAKELIELAVEASNMRKQKQISLKSVAKQPTMRSLALRFILLLATLPYTLATILLTLPITVISMALTKKFKDRAFHNSVRFVLQLLLWPLLMVIYTVLAFIYLPTPLALCIMVATVPAPAIAQDTYRAIRLTISDFKLLHRKSLAAKYNEIRNLFFK